jgi:hypothetical protein
VCVCSVEGNPERGLWKICESGGVNKWERALMGATVGHRESMLAVAQSWEDKVRQLQPPDLFNYDFSTFCYSCTVTNFALLLGMGLVEGSE